MRFLAGFVLVTVICGFPLESEMEERKINPEAITNAIIDDIVLPKSETSRSGRNGLTDSSKQWPKTFNGQVTVPFKMQGRYCRKITRKSSNL